VEVSEIPPGQCRGVFLQWAYRLIREDSGEDLVEYGLLTAFIGLAGVAVFGLIMAGLNSGYTNWDSGTQGLWEMPPPI
jgi:Flp pilus assembly pilin Flp